MNKLDDTTPMDLKTFEFLMNRPLTEHERLLRYEADKRRFVARGLTGYEYEQACREAAERWQI